MEKNEAFEQQKFKPGQSGNPGGRPKGFKGLTETLKELVNEDGTMTIAEVYEVDEKGVETGRKFARAIVKIPRKDMIILAAMKKSMKGDMRAIEFIFDRIDGKAKQAVDIQAEVTTKEKGFWDYVKDLDNGK